MTAFSETLKITWTGPGSTSLSGSVSRTGDTEGGASIDLTASVANKHVVLSIRKDGVNLLYLRSTTGCTIYWNDVSGGSPAGHLDLTAGIPFHYLRSAGMTNPLSADVTDLYVTETDAANGTLEARWVEDGTP